MVNSATVRGDKGDKNTREYSSQSNNDRRTIHKARIPTPSPNAPPARNNKHYDVQFAESEEPEEQQPETGDDSYQVNMSLLNAVEHPLPKEIESVADIAVDQESPIKANNLLYILSQADTKKKKGQIF